MWQPQRSSLSSTVRMITPDLPGFGNSPAHNWSVDGIATVLGRFIQEVAPGEKVVIGGLSMGGYVALAFARHHPELLRGLILADTKAEPDAPAAKAAREQSMTLVKEQGVPALFAQMEPKALGETTRAQRPDVVSQARSIANRQPAEGVLAALVALRDRPGATDGLTKVNVPTLVIVGAEDTITPLSGAETMAKAIPQAKLVTIPTAGHLSNLETASEFTDAIRDYLSTLPR